MSVLDDLIAFIPALWDYWQALVFGAVLLLVDIVERSTSDELRKKNRVLKWSEDHRVFRRLSYACLLVACFLAWRDEHHTAQQSRIEMGSMKSNETALLGQIKEKDGRISDLQTAVARSPVPVEVQIRSTGPLPDYTFCVDAAVFSSPGGFPPGGDWQEAESCRDVMLPWDELAGVDAVVDLKTRTVQRGKWVQGRVWDVTHQKEVATGPQSTEADYDAGGQRVHLALPRGQGNTTYRLQLRWVKGGGGFISGLMSLKRGQ